MPLNPLNNHYAIENPASVYDEEAMTALGLAGRTTAKVNETVEAFNNLETETNNHLVEQDKTITQRMQAQDNRLTVMEKTTIPNTVDTEMQSRIDNGDFERAIDQYAGELEARVNNLFTGVSEGSTTMDAEVIDIRVGEAGATFKNAGDAVRRSIASLKDKAHNLSVYSIDLVKKTSGIEEIYNDTIAKRDGGYEWCYTSFPFTAKPGTYTLVVECCNLPQTGNVGLFIKKTVTTGLYYPTAIKKAGAYEFTIPETETDENFVILMQICDSNVNPSDYYYADIHMYKGKLNEGQGLPDYFTGVDKCLHKTYGKNLFNKANIVEHYYLADKGQVVAELADYGTQFYSHPIPVTPGEKYAITMLYAGATYVAFYEQEASTQAVKLLDDSYASYMVSTLSNTAGVLTAPEGANFMRLSGPLSTVNSIQVEVGDKCTSFEPYTENAPLTAVENRVTKIESVLDSKEQIKANAPQSVKAVSLASGGAISLNVPNIKNGEHITFTCDFDSFAGSLIISHGKNTPYSSSYIEVGASTLKAFGYYSGATELGSFAHGLTLSKNIAIDITTGLNEAHVRISSGGSSYETDVKWEGSAESIKAESVGMSIQNVSLMAYHAGLNKDTWLFGDSYFDYWAPIAYEQGCTNALYDSYSGRNCMGAVESLRKCLDKATPKRIVWLMGINDGDTTSTVNANWNSAYMTLKDLCTAANIELILSTVPSTPTVNNKYKNLIVRNSGYRYLDIENAVGSGDTGVWYTGYMAGDNVHPSDIGKEVIAQYICAGVPEIYNY